MLKFDLDERNLITIVDVVVVFFTRAGSLIPLELCREVFDVLRVYLVLAAFIFSGGALRLLGTFLLASYSSVAF